MVHYRETERSIGWDDQRVLDELTEEIEDALEARPDAAGVGIGVPATIDRKRGVAIRGVNLKLENVPVRDVLSERLQVPVSLDNDANLAALAEHRFGAARGTKVAVLLTLGTGIGGGIIIDGELFRGDKARAPSLVTSSSTKTGCPVRANARTAGA